MLYYIVRIYICMYHVYTAEESHYHQRNRSGDQSFEEYVAAWPPPAFNPGEDGSDFRASGFVIEH